jgi:DNA-directed RNA polymerase beta subunit
LAADKDSDIPQASTAQLVQDGQAAAALSEDKIVVLTRKRQQKYYWHTQEEYIYRDCKMCQIPVMVGSAPCYLSDGTNDEDKNLSVDPRGYFIVEGQEKVCIA